MNTSAPDRAAAVKLAISYLDGIGIQVRDHDWKQPDGGLDIVAFDRHALVACVVKVASGRRFGTPLEAISSAARRRLRGLAARWLTEHGIRADQIRIDVIGLLPEGTGGFTIEHVRGVA